MSRMTYLELDCLSDAELAIKLRELDRLLRDPRAVAPRAAHEHRELRLEISRRGMLREREIRAAISDARNQARNWRLPHPPNRSITRGVRLHLENLFEHGLSADELRAIFDAVLADARAQEQS